MRRASLRLLLVDEARATWKETLEIGSVKAIREEEREEGEEYGRQEEAGGGGGG